MGHIRYEWKKFAEFRFFWLLCCVFLLFNLWGISDKAKVSGFPAEAVKKIYADLNNQPKEKRGEWIQQLQKNKIPQYTGNSYAEKELYKKLSQEMIQNSQYERYLDEIKQKSESMSSVIFSNEGTFAYRNAKKTPEVFEHLYGLRLETDVSDGVILAVQNGFTDVCMVLALTAMVYFLILYEKRGKLYPLLKSSYRGRVHVMAAKLVVASVLTVFFVLLFYGSNYLFAYCKYGFGDLDRPVQSVAGMYESPYMLTVGTFLVLYIVLKMAVCFVIVLIMIWFAQKMSTPSGAVLGIGIAGVVEYLLYLLLPSVSYMDAFKYINLVEYIQVYPLISKYHNLDFFEYPVNGMTLFKGVLPLVCILFLVLNLRKFAKCEKTLGKKAWNRKRERRYFIVTDKLFLHEAVKNLLTNRTIWLCAIVLYGAFMLGEGISAYKNIEESYYRYYIMEYAGHITEDTLEYFKAEKKKYDAIHSLTPENSGLSQQEISIKQDEIRDQYSGFMKAYEQVRDVLYNNQKIGKNQQELVYVTGYEELFGERAVNRNTRLIGILLCAVIAIYSASSVLGMEYDLKVMNLLRSTKKGREKLLFSKLETAFGVTFLMAVLIKIPMVLKIAKAYPLENWDAKVRSMMFAGQSVFDCTIWEYVFLLILAQMVSLFVIVLVVVVLSAILKDTILTCIFSIILFGGPLVLEWSGLRSIHYWSLNALLDAHSLFQYGWDMLILQVLIFWICIPLIAGYILYEIYERRK